MCQHKLGWTAIHPRIVHCHYCSKFIISSSSHACFTCDYHECDTCYHKKLEEQKFGGENCPVCTKAVYSAEPSVAADGNKFHESCFRTLESKRLLAKQRNIIANIKAIGCKATPPPNYLQPPRAPLSISEHVRLQKLSINPKLAKPIEKIKPINTVSINEKFYNASKSGNINDVRRYLNMGANKNIIMTNGYTALMIASENGYLDIVQHLLSLKVNVDIKNKDNKCAMLLAKNNKILLEFI
jgi:hypothetical protein